MREIHLSDEAVAAFADDVLTGHARERARRHTASCPECNYAVAIQREAVWALRAAPAPALPTGLLDRLRDVPTTTPVHRVPAFVDERGTPMFPAFGTAAAFVPAQRRAAAPATSTPKPAEPHHSHRTRSFVIAAASLAVMGSLTGTAVADSGANDAAPAVQPAPASAAPYDPQDTAGDTAQDTAVHTVLTPQAPVRFAREFAPLGP